MPPRYLVHVILVTGDPLAKVEPIVAAFERQRTDDVRLTIVTGYAGSASESNPRNLDVRRFPGANVFEVRRHIPVIVDDAQWVILLEDHNHLHDAWLSGLCAALQAAPDDITAVVGGADNRTSTDPWSWANFLMVLGFYWAPMEQAPPEPLFFNVAFRRALLPNHTYEFGELEVPALERLTSRAQRVGTFAIDHVQFRSFPFVLYYHWCNGRVTGANMRKLHPQGYWHVMKHAVRVAGSRWRQLGTVIKEHPRAAALPGGTAARVWLLSCCHAVGALAGGLVGKGRAPWALE